MLTSSRRCIRRHHFRDMQVAGCWGDMQPTSAHRAKSWLTDDEARIFIQERWDIALGCL